MNRRAAARALRSGELYSPMRAEDTDRPFCVIVTHSEGRFQSYLSYYPKKTTFTVSARQVLSFIRHNFAR